MEETKKRAGAVTLQGEDGALKERGRCVGWQACAAGFTAPEVGVESKDRRGGRKCARGCLAPSLTT
jgi:hypothetical protein